MAGRGRAPSSTTTSSDLENSSRESQISSVIDQWEVQYSRFISNSSCTRKRTHPSLSPYQNRRLTDGTWISATVASLKLEYRRPSTGASCAVIVVVIRSQVLEEHCVTLMNFSWPQVSCVSGFPERGCRSVLVSYKDGVGQASICMILSMSFLQKFALRFSTIHDSGTFMAIVKEIMESGKIKLIGSPVSKSKMSSQDEVISFDGPAHRNEVDQKWKAAEVNSTQVMLPSSKLDKVQDSESPEKIIDYEPANAMPVLPPSFSQLMKNCYPAVTEEKPMELEGDLKTQFMRYLERTSFTDLLATVEDVISVLDGDIEL
ncbi:poor homologous synapsis 1 [Striga asiatica]|uniref:Poor homologous synapsis 1 n=1 Tax=Striga asiatica TaxID=4170 RepID=A0A5A7R2H7_STRAF|nr:poor homologous synapsis 1 [Striga asiatica]